MNKHYFFQYFTENVIIYFYMYIDTKLKKMGKFISRKINFLFQYKCILYYLYNSVFLK